MAEEKDEYILVQPLTKAIPAHGEDVKELKFREPSGLDIEKCGMPVSMQFKDGAIQYLPNPAAMTEMMSLLAGVPPSSIRKLHSRDWTTISYKLANFFVPDLGTATAQSPE